MAANKSDMHVRILADNSSFIKGLDQSTRKVQDFDKQVGSTLGGMAAKFTSVAAAAALIGKTLKDATGTIMDFEAANSQLASVLGTNLKGVERLTTAAKDLGRNTQYTASEVTSLQTALARLGFSAEQITAMQDPVLRFAAAVGTDLGSAAEFTGSALRAFGLSANDANRLLDVMAASTAKSALDFNKLQQSIGTVAPVAHSFGLTAQDTAALLGGLANAGFDASRASTALRNILLNLADSNGKLAKGLGHSANNFDEIIASLRELRERGVDLNETLEMTDNRSVAAFNAFIDGVDSVDALRDSLLNCSGTLDTMYSVMTDNLQGAVNNLKSAWEGLQLAFSASAGPMRTVVNGLTDITNRLTDIVSGDKVTFWEAILGPISGGLLGARRRRNQAAAMTSDTTVDDIFGVWLNNAPGVTTTTTTTSGGKGGKTGDKFVDSLGILNRVERMSAEIDRWWAAEQRNYESSLEDFALDLQPILDEIQEEITDAFLPLGEDGNLQAYLDMQLNDISDSFSKFRTLSEETAAVLQNSLISSFQELANVLAGIDGSNFGTVMSALLTPLADLAITAGTIIMTSGEAIKALVNSLHLADKGVGAIIAGGLLVGVGVAAKAGLAGLAQSAGGYSSATSVASSGGYGSYSNEYSMREMNVNVSGTLTADGSKLVAVINNTNKKKGYTT